MLNGRLYVMGGGDSNKLQVLEMTEENGLSWSCKADLPAIRSGAASVAHEGKIWVMGGCVAGEGPSASVIIYDAEADAWETAPSLPETSIDGSAFTFDGHISLFTKDRRFEYRSAAWSRVEGWSADEESVCGSVELMERGAQISQFLQLICA